MPLQLQLVIRVLVLALAANDGIGRPWGLVRDHFIEYCAKSSGGYYNTSTGGVCCICRTGQLHTSDCNETDPTSTGCQYTTTRQTTSHTPTPTQGTESNTTQLANSAERPARTEAHPKIIHVSIDVEARLKAGIYRMIGLLTTIFILIGIVMYDAYRIERDTLRREARDSEDEPEARQPGCEANVYEEIRVPNRGEPEGALASPRPTINQGTMTDARTLRAESPELGLKLPRQTDVKCYRHPKSKVDICTMGSRMRDRFWYQQVVASAGVGPTSAIIRRVDGICLRLCNDSPSRFATVLNHFWRGQDFGIRFQLWETIEAGYQTPELKDRCGTLYKELPEWVKQQVWGLKHPELHYHTANMSCVVSLVVMALDNYCSWMLALLAFEVQPDAKMFEDLSRLRRTIEVTHLAVRCGALPAFETHIEYASHIPVVEEGDKE